MRTYSASVAFLRNAGVEFVAGIERLWRLDLAADLQLLGAELVSEGVEDGVGATTSAVFRGAFVAQAARIVLVHNHPGGRREPSSRDLAVTRRLAVFGSMLNAPLHDHLVVAQDQLYSFRRAGLL